MKIKVLSQYSVAHAGHATANREHCAFHSPYKTCTADNREMYTVSAMQHSQNRKWKMSDRTPSERMNDIESYIIPHANGSAKIHIGGLRGDHFVDGDGFIPLFIPNPFSHFGPNLTIST